MGERCSVLLKDAERFVQAINLAPIAVSSFSTIENRPSHSSIIDLGLAQVVCEATQRPPSMNRIPISEVSVEPSGLS